MDFSVDVRLSHPPALVQDAFLDPTFVGITGTLSKVGDAEVLERERDPHTARLRVRYRFTAPLSRAVTAIVDPAKLTWVDDGHFDLARMRSEHTLLPDHYADRLESSYVSTLTADGDGTRWSVTGSLVVHAAIVGGRVAAVIVDGLREHAAAEGAACDAWLREHTPRAD